jgi:hypothetical protein
MPIFVSFVDEKIAEEVSSYIHMCQHLIVLKDMHISYVIITISDMLRTLYPL